MRVCSFLLEGEGMLGESIQRALELVGITEERVSRWVGGECGCKDRKERLDRLGVWAWRILRGKWWDVEEVLREDYDRDED